MVGGMSLGSLTSEQTLDALRAIGEETRLRIVAVLRHGELTVTDLTEILGQSQPRVSRHLKLLVDAGLVLATRRKGWVYYRRNEDMLTTVADRMAKI